MHYIGVTLNGLQFEVARRRVNREIQELKRGDAASSLSSLALFQADGAKPERWPQAVQDAVKTLAEQKCAERWLLALDCLYHFSPSRRPILSFAAQNLKGNFAAFDLLINGSAPWHQRKLARVVGLLMGCSSSAFLTEEEYKKQLLGCGYAEESFVFRDISNKVFPGLIGHMIRQEEGLRNYGISLGAGFKVARAVFGWFWRTSVIRAVIVTGKLDPDSKVLQKGTERENSGGIRL
jgi:hypothetical protein